MSGNRQRCDDDFSVFPPQAVAMLPEQVHQPHSRAKQQRAVKPTIWNAAEKREGQLQQTATSVSPSRYDHPQAVARFGN